MFGWLRKLWQTPAPAAQRANELRVTESIYGTWYYHLARKNEYKALCGAHVMNSGIPLTDWGEKTELGERWCSVCARGLK